MRAKQFASLQRGAQRAKELRGEQLYKLRGGGEDLRPERMAIFQELKVGRYSTGVGLHLPSLAEPSGECEMGGQAWSRPHPEGSPTL